MASAVRASRLLGILAGKDSAQPLSALASGTAGWRTWTSHAPFAGMTQAGSTGMFSASTLLAPRWTRSICETRYELSRSEPQLDTSEKSSAPLRFHAGCEVLLPSHAAGGAALHDP